jgi:hypothetical protein
MTFTLRVDVDVPYGYHSRFRRVMNRLLLDYRLPIRFEHLGYLSPSIGLLGYLEDRGISASWFFGTFSLPSKNHLRSFEKNGLIGFHSERTRTLEEFQEEYANWYNRAGREPAALSKHGSGEQKLSKRHHPEYKPKEILEYASRLNIPIVIGNDVNYQDEWQRYNGVYFIPSVYWIDYPPFYPPEHSVTNVIDAAKEHDIIILVHPVWWVLRKELRTQLDSLIKNCEFIPFRRMLQTHEWE